MILTTPAKLAPRRFHYLAIYDAASRDFVVIDTDRNIVVDHLPDLLQCEVLIEQLSAAEREEKR